jgi:hypothetical protein
MRSQEIEAQVLVVQGRGQGQGYLSSEVELHFLFFVSGVCFFIFVQYFCIGKDCSDSVVDAAAFFMRQ